LTGHDRRNCPTNPSTAGTGRGGRGRGGRGGGRGRGSTAPVAAPPPPTPPTPLNTTVYVVFDLETTGFRGQPSADIIELAADILLPNGIHFEGASFSSYVKPRLPIPALITGLTTITDDDVRDADDFSQVGKRFVGFIIENIRELETSGQTIQHVVLVAHNGRSFDIPFLFESMRKYKVDEWVSFLDSYTFFELETLHLARQSFKATKPSVIP
jgi:DNA polymerase III alpha subunit (gram-positive type)